MSSSHDGSSQSSRFQNEVDDLLGEIDFQSVLLASLDDEGVENPQEAKEDAHNEINKLKKALDELQHNRKKERALQKARKQSKAGSSSKAGAGRSSNARVASADSSSDSGMSPLSKLSSHVLKFIVNRDRS